MRDNNWHAVGPTATDAEAEALDAVRQLLPDDPMCHAWTNVEFQDRTGNINEVDLILLSARGLYVIELKGWHGRIQGKMNEWRHETPSGRVTRIENPVNGINRKAKRLKGLLLAEHNPDRISSSQLWVEPAVVMHGRRSVVELSENTHGSVYGLDGFGVAGALPRFTELLGGPPKYDRSTFNAFLRLLQNSGLCPRATHTEDPAPLVLPQTDATTTAMDVISASAEPADVEAVEPVPLFTSFSDEDLGALGVSSEDIPAVRTAIDIESLVGLLPDPVWEDLEAVASGEEVGAVLARRHLTQERFTQVDEAAAAAGWAPEPAAEVEPAAQPSSAEPEPPTHEPMSEMERKLKEVFGDRVTSARRPQLSASTGDAEPDRGSDAEAADRQLIPAETLLGVARTEALAGRAAPAVALHELVRSAFEEDLKVDWTLEEVTSLVLRLQQFPLLAHRLSEMVNTLRHGEPLAPQISSGQEREVGSLWREAHLGPTYSLLVRMPDVLDRRSGVFLSQVIGPDAARSVNERLRQGRPDGGRIRVAEDGTVISRRDPSSPWFVVGQVRAHEWFLPEVVRAA